MKSNQDIRWIQRFNNFKRAFSQLTEAVNIAKIKELSNLEEQGLIQSFEYTHELAWNVLKDFLQEKGVQNIYGSKDATREAFAVNLIENGEVWMDMIKSRNKTTHTYNKETAREITKAIIEEYFSQFQKLQKKLEEQIS